VKHGSPVNLACAPLPPSSCNPTLLLTIRLQLFLTFSLSISSQMFFTFLFLDTIVFYAFFRIIFLYLGAHVETGSCRAHSLTLSIPLSPPHKEYYLLCMHAAGSWRLEWPGRSERLRKRSGLQHGPPHIITIYFLESVRGERVISSPSPVSLFSADARRAIRFRLSTVYSITVPHVSEIARQRVSPLVSSVRAGLSGVRAYES
jgi:hypothetical protein